jgi:hypothetical protein
VTKQALIYESVIPISPQNHGTLCVENEVGFGFARNLRAVPLVASEIGLAAREFAVVFAPAGNDAQVIPMAILGFREGENHYLSENGEFTATYVPGFLRRYPFVFAPTGDDSTFALCIDESWRACNREGRGERLYDHQGNPTAFLKSWASFSEEYQKHAKMTEAFSEQITELDLLSAKQAQLETPAGESVNLTGFLAADRGKLRSLPGETLERLSRNGSLELLYAHLISLSNLGSIAGRMRGTQATSAN